MGVSDLVARIDRARDGHRRAAEMLPGSHSTGEDDFDWDDGRDVGELFGELFGGAVGSSLGSRGGAALGGLLGPVGAVAGGIILGAVGHVVGSEFGSVVGGELGEEIEDLLEGRGFGTGDEDSEDRTPAPRPGDPIPQAGQPVPGLDPEKSKYGPPNGSTTSAARAYDARVNRNNTGLAVYLDNPGSGSHNRDTEFDWIEYGPNGEITLLDAKHYITGGIFTAPFGIDDRLEKTLEQADRQIEAMQHTGIDPKNIRIEWRVAGPEATELLRDLFHDNGIDIEVVYVP